TTHEQGNTTTKSTNRSDVVAGVNGSNNGDENDDNDDSSARRGPKVSDAELRDRALAAALHPCLCSPVAWWTHRALSTAAVHETEG
ncbi:hypothetical protein IAI27_11135, partial [Streptococcus pseudopneumoniae]|uniref:hypothetical protein n=1 Tax=Streptococcus pseudopneumoniae TaxID=257758 RepID=UPI0018B03F6C